jgi:hypothetical protein
MSIVPLLSSQAGGAFGDTPLLIPNLGLWLKADAGITLVGGAVDGWADQSGNGRDFSAPALANRPAYSGTLNDLPVLTFDGSTDYLNGGANALTICTSLTVLTIITALKYGASATQRAFAISAGNAATAGRVSMGVSTTQYELGARRLDSDVTFTTIAGGTPTTSPTIHSSVVRFSAGTGAIFANGASQVDTTLTTAGTSDATNSLRVLVGVGTTLSGTFMSGDIAEIIVYQRAISVEERNSVERYLSVKWGIAI